MQGGTEMINSLNKGKRWERDAAKLLTKTTGAEWHRVPMSGAYATQNPKLKTQNFKADLFTEDERYASMTVECKAVRFLSVNMMFNKKSMLHEWIRKLEFTTGKEAGTDWVLLIRPDNQGIVALSTNPEALEKLFPGNNKYLTLFQAYYMIKVK